MFLLKDKEQYFEIIWIACVCVEYSLTLIYLPNTYSVWYLSKTYLISLEQGGKKSLKALFCVCRITQELLFLLGFFQGFIRRPKNERGVWSANSFSLFYFVYQYRCTRKIENYFKINTSLMDAYNGFRNISYAFTENTFLKVNFYVNTFDNFIRLFKHT